jgi:hypothetical protein
MKLDFTGKALFLFKINIHEDVSASHYQPVPQHLTLQGGIELLEKPEETRTAGDGAHASHGPR